MLNDANLDYLISMMGHNGDAETLGNIVKALWRANRVDPGCSPAVNASGKHLEYAVRTFGGEFCPGYELGLWRHLFSFRSDKEAAKTMDRSTVTMMLMNNLVDAYHHLAYLNDIIDAFRLSLSLYRDFGSQMKKSGEMSDATKIKAAVRNMENRLFAFQNQRREHQVCLSLLLGKEREVEFPCPLTLYRVQAPVRLNLPLKVLARRPDVRGALRKAGLDGGSLRGIDLASALQLMKEKQDGTPLFAANFFKTDMDARAIWGLEQIIGSALDEFDLYYGVYLRAIENFSISESKYARQWQKWHGCEANRVIDEESVEDGLRYLQTMNAARLTMLKHRYQMVQYEDMLHKLIGTWSGRADGHAALSRSVAGKTEQFLSE